MMVCIFYQVNLFLQHPVTTPSQINLIKKAKKSFLLVKKFKNTSSAQLQRVHRRRTAVCQSICTDKFFRGRQFFWGEGAAKYVRYIGNERERKGNENRREISRGEK